MVTTTSLFISRRVRLRRGLFWEHELSRDIDLIVQKRVVKVSCDNRLVNI